MFEPNASLVILRIQEACRFQVLQVLREKGLRIVDYKTMEVADPVDPIIGRYEFVIADTSELDAEKVVKSALRSATGPATVTVERVYFQHNEWDDPDWGIHHHHQKKSH